MPSASKSRQSLFAECRSCLGYRCCRFFNCHGLCNCFSACFPSCRCPCCHGHRSTVRLQVLTELRSKVLQKGGIQHLFEPRHLVSRFRKGDKGRVFHFPRSPRQDSLGRRVHSCLVLRGIMHYVVDCELMMGPGSSQLASASLDHVEEVASLTSYDLTVATRAGKTCSTSARDLLGMPSPRGRVLWIKSLAKTARHSSASHFPQASRNRCSVAACTSVEADILICFSVFVYLMIK